MQKLTHHSENTKRIIAYLSYLREISRKIVFHNGFEKCLINKTKTDKNAVQFDKLNIEENEQLHRNFDLCRKIIEQNPDKKLFFGFGIIAGESTRTFAAPLITLQCDLSIDEKNTLSIVPLLNSLTLNYDLIAALSKNNFINESDEEVIVIDDTENTIIEGIETQINNITYFDTEELSKLSFQIFKIFKSNLASFKNVFFNENPYSFNDELSLWKRNKDKKTANNKSQGKSIFEKEISFTKANHFFISPVPDQLSTYQALDSFVKSIVEENDFKNPVVEKLLINALTANRANIDYQEDKEIEEVIKHFIPLSLSNSQIKAIKNAWTNEISYIQGPPGTGKSHTISAIVLSAVALNKKVLVISQKPPALDVVNKKIEPYLTDSDDGLLGICYYDRTARKKLKEYCKFLMDVSDHREIEILQKSVKELENALKTQFNQLSSEQKKLDKSLDKQRIHKEQNDIFLKAFAQFERDYYKIPKGFKFKRIKKFKNYEIILQKIERIFEAGNKTLATKLFTNKFKKHLKNKFEVPVEWLEKSEFPSFSEVFIILNNLFTSVQKSYDELNTNTNGIRKKIKNLKENILSNQKQLIKLKYRLNVLSFITESAYQSEIDKLSRMFHNITPSIIDKKMQSIDFNKITDVIPFWTAEIRHLGYLLPLQTEIFDLVVVDEASQVNLAEIIPAFYRGKKICIVGDHNQLSLKASGLNFTLSKKFDELTWEKYNSNFMRYQNATKKNLIVTQASILDFIRNEEYQATIKEVMLDEHFRSLPHLAQYTSKEFYRDEDNPDGRLKIMTETPDKLAINCFKAIRVKGLRDTEMKMKHIVAEAKEVVQIIKNLINIQTPNLFKNDFKFPEHIDKNNFTIGVISMIRDQCNLIYELLENSDIPSAKLKKFGIDIDLKEGIGTPEEFQGNEKDIMIFSLCLDTTCKMGQGFFQDEKRLNVATSRAKSFTYFVYSPFPKSFNKIIRYITQMGIHLSDEDLIPIPQSELIPNLPPLNPDKFESDFERYVYYYLNKFVNDHCNNGNKLTLHNQVKSCGQKRLDFVIFNQTTKKSAAVEVDGRYHFANGLSENYTREHNERIEMLTRAGWNIINTPYHKWYKDGWLSEENDNYFKQEITRIYEEIDRFIS